MLAIDTSHIRQEVQKLKGLPPLPVIAQQLLGAIDDERATIEDISDIIQRDPSLMARLLGLANSAFFSFGRKILTLQEAVIFVLGLDMVKSISLSMVMSGTFDVKRCKHFDVNRYWASSLLSAELAKQVAGLMGSADQAKQNQMYLLGLLHNLGILILVDRFPEVMDKVFKEALEDPSEALMYKMREMIDIDHHQAGSWLAHKWHLPEEVIHTIEHHYDIGYSGDHSQEVLLVGLCSRTVRNWLLGSDTLIPEKEVTLIHKLGIEVSKFEGVAEKCYSKLEEVEALANEMSS